MVITQNEKDSFFNQGFFVRKKTISETTVESAKIAYTKMRKKCEKKIYNRYRIFNDIALNDIYPEITLDNSFDVIGIIIQKNDNRKITHYK